MDDDMKAKVERSSLGTPEAQALRATVSDEQSARLVARAKELEQQTDDAQVVHGIDRHTQDHLCGAPAGIGTDALAPSTPITCAGCRAAWPDLREGDCWLCKHPVWGPLCSACGCLAHYPPWASETSNPPVKGAGDA